MAGYSRLRGAGEAGVTALRPCRSGEQSFLLPAGDENYAFTIRQCLLCNIVINKSYF